MALRHEKRLLQKSEINLGREGTSQAANFPELRNEIVALKKLEQEQKEVALRIAQIEEGIKKIEEQRATNAKEQAEAMSDLEAQTTAVSARRARLPDDRAELVRARMGTSDASRIAKEKLAAADEELGAIEKNIAKVRGEYEARDKSFADNIRAQQDAVREAK